MNNANKNNTDNKLQYWGVRFLLAGILIIIGYKTPIIWLSISVAFWMVYGTLILTSPFLIAASQNSNFARTTHRTLSVLGTFATAALISAPIVILHWY